MIVKRALAALFIFICFNLHANELWAVHCNAGKGYIKFNHIKTEMIVNSNQISISVSIVKHDDKLSFFLNEPIDLGRGGMMLGWEHFSKERAIADAVISGDHIVLSWRGFFDKRKTKYMWVSESDFSPPSDKKEVILSRCD